MISLASVACAWRLRGELFALVVALLLGVFDLAQTRYRLTSAWNPFIVALPFALLALTSVRLALRDLKVLPLAAFLASWIVQSHIGYAPAVAFLLSVPAALAALQFFRAPSRAALRRAAPYFAGAGALSALMWSLPLYESFTNERGNFRLLWEFFSKQRAPAHDYAEVTAALARDLSVVPLSALRFASTLQLGPLAEQLAALLLVVGLGIGAVYALRRRSRTVALLCLFSLGLIALSWFAVRSIVGPLYDYLTVWVMVVGVFAHAALLAVLLPEPAVAEPRTRQRAVLVVLCAVLLGVGAARDQQPIFEPPNEAFEKVARAVEARLRDGRAQPLLKRGELAVWARSLGLAVHLYKHRIPFFADRQLQVFTSARFRAPRAPRQHLLLTRKPLSERVCRKKRCEQIAAADKLLAYLKAR